MDTIKKALGTITRVNTIIRCPHCKDEYELDFFTLSSDISIESLQDDMTRDFRKKILTEQLKQIEEYEQEHP